MHLHLPALRDRGDEIIPLAEMFISTYAAKYRRSVAELDDEAKTLLMEHRWSGNIRELQNCIEKAVIMSDGELLTAADLQLTPEKEAPGAESHEGGETLEMAEEKAIRAAMAKFGGNLSMVAKSLQISRPTLYTKLKKYDI